MGQEQKEMLNTRGLWPSTAAKRGCCRPCRSVLRSAKTWMGGGSTSVYQGGRPQQAFQALRSYRENSQQNQQPLSCSSGTVPILYLPRVKVTGQQHRDLCLGGQWPHHPRYQAFSFNMLSQLGTPRTRNVEARGGRV